MDFRPAYAALAARLAADLADIVREVSRQNRPATSFDNQPALVVLETGDDPILDDLSRPVAYDVHATLVLHSKDGGEDLVPGDTVIQIRGRIEDALRWRLGEPESVDGYWSTLGGVVRSVRLGSVKITDNLRNPFQTSTLFDVTMTVTP